MGEPELDRVAHPAGKQQVLPGGARPFPLAQHSHQLLRFFHPLRLLLTDGVREALVDFLLGLLEQLDVVLAPHVLPDVQVDARVVGGFGRVGLQDGDEPPLLPQVGYRYESPALLIGQAEVSRLFRRLEGLYAAPFRLAFRAKIVVFALN